jgi:hypothetical protein
LEIIILSLVKNGPHILISWLITEDISLYSQRISLKLYNIIILLVLPSNS